MTNEQGPIPASAAESLMSTRERNMLIVKLLVVLCLLTGPLTVFIGVVIYAMHRNEEAHPSSHRSVASVQCEPSRSA